MTLPDGYHSRPLTNEDRRLVVELDTWAFPTSTEIDDILGVPSPLTWDRTSGIEADGSDGLAAMHASYPFTGFQVPGAHSMTTATPGRAHLGRYPGQRWSRS